MKARSQMALPLLLILTAFHIAYARPVDPLVRSKLTQRLVDSTDLIGNLIADSLMEIAPGITETDIHYTDRAGRAMHLFILQVDLNQPEVSLEVATPDNLPIFTRQSVLAQAVLVDTAGHQVMAGINGDFFNMHNGIPLGIVHQNGTVIKGIFMDNKKKPQQAVSFFGVTKAGTPYIDFKSGYASIREQLYHATGSGVLLVNNHVAVKQPYTAIAPRTAVGYDDEGMIYFAIVDGRDIPYSNGMNYAQLSSIFMAFGAQKAVNLDGGGSTTLLTRNPLTDVLEVRNRPSDGAPRAVANAWLVISKTQSNRHRKTYNANEIPSCPRRDLDDDDN